METLQLKIKFYRIIGVKMTIVLKSNNVAKAAISDKHGLQVAKDWKVMLDFENNLFLEKSASDVLSRTITDLLSVENTNPIVYTKDGEYVVLPDNTPRLSLNRNGTVFGLLEETTATNYYFPSDNPVSKTINLVQGQNTGPWVVKMVGAGSVKVTGSSITSSTSAEFTELQPGYFMVDSPLAIAQVAVEVIGEVKHLSIIVSGFGSNGYTDNALIKTQLGAWWAASGLTKIKPEKVTQHLLNKKNFSIVFQCVDNDYLNFSFTDTVYKPLVELVNLNKHISIIKRKTGSAAEEIAIRLFNNSEVIIPLTGTQKASTIAISSGDNGLMFAVNGNVTNPSQIMNGFTVSDILIGSSTEWVASSIRAKAQGVFTKFVMYDRQLNADELRRVTQSFQ